MEGRGGVMRNFFTTKTRHFVEGSKKVTSSHTPPLCEFRNICVILSSTLRPCPVRAEGKRNRKKKVSKPNCIFFHVISQSI